MRRNLEHAGEVDPETAAKAAGLHYASDQIAGLLRRRSGRGFVYLDLDRRPIRNADAIRRIRHIVIPPAWTEVWICPFANGHIQASGRDARGRKQYRYHPAFRELRESSKYEHMMQFAEVLPTIRRTVNEHMGWRGLPREKVLAAVVYLLERTLIRVGNDDYARTNGSFGLTTLKSRHAVVNGSQVRFEFTGKGGRKWSVAMTDRRVARIIKACQELPGQELLQYVDEVGCRRDVSSADINGYLREITGRDVTAKDFRTFGGTILAALALHELGPGSSKKNVRIAIERVAARLGNTPTICRKCYVHPEVVNAYLEGALHLEIAATIDPEVSFGLTAEEGAVIAMLRARSKRKGNGTAARYDQKAA